MKERRLYVETLIGKSDGIAGRENEFIFVGVLRHKARELRIGDAGAGYEILKFFFSREEREMVTLFHFWQQGEDGAVGVAIPRVVRRVAEEDVVPRYDASLKRALNRGDDIDGGNQKKSG